MIRKEVVFAVLATFCFCVLTFVVMPIGGQLPYDPWTDIDNDGKIDMYDIGYAAQRFGATGEPINRTQTILDLQNRINALEEKQDYVKTLRFCQAAEVGVDDYQMRDVAIFTWVPRNATNNAVYGGCLYLQFNTTDSGQMGISWRLLINDNQLCAGNDNGKLNTYTQTAVQNFAGFTPFPQPNQSQYTIKVRCSGLHVYAKDINILLEVMDGLPAS